MEKLSKQGIALLIIVVSVGLISVGTILSVGLLRVRHSQYRLLSEKTYQLQTQAEACIEYGLEHIRRSSLNEGEFTLSVGDESCILTVVRNGENWTLSSFAKKNEYTNRIRVQAHIVDGQVQIQDWNTE